MDKDGMRLLCCHHPASNRLPAWYVLQVENGDLNWILPGKLLAFSGPAVRPTDYVGFRAMVPEDYWEYFRRRGIQAIVRLNKKVSTGLACSRFEPVLPAG
jgi:hypothetical protein